MTQDEIRAIALEVAKEMGFRCVEDYILFATRFLAAITEKAEPVGEVDSFGRVILKYSPMHGTKLFTNPAIEPAGEVVDALNSALEIVEHDRCDGDSAFAYGVNAACKRHAAGIRNLIDKVKK